LFNLSDPGAEEALYESTSMRKCAGVDLGNAAVLDETTICKFRYLLEKHDLGKKLFAEVNAHLRDCGVKVSGRRIVDATIIAAPGATRNQK